MRRRRRSFQFLNVWFQLAHIRVVRIIIRLGNTFQINHISIKVNTVVQGWRYHTVCWNGLIYCIQFCARLLMIICKKRLVEWRIQIVDHICHKYNSFINIIFNYISIVHKKWNEIQSYMFLFFSFYIIIKKYFFVFLFLFFVFSFSFFFFSFFLFLFFFFLIQSEVHSLLFNWYLFWETPHHLRNPCLPTFSWLAVFFRVQERERTLVSVWRRWAEEEEEELPRLQLE